MDNSDGGKIVITVPSVFFIVLLNWNKKKQKTKTPKVGKC